jgi:hypothetical protein
MKRRTAIAWIALCALCIVSMGLAAQPASRAQSNPAAAQQPVSSARFAFGGNAAEIPAEFVDHLVFLPVHVNQGGPSLFQLDSTAPVSSIDPGRAAELGIANLQAPTLNLSGVDISLAALAAIANKDFAARVGRPYEGTLGTDFLASVVVELDYARQTVRLYDPAAYRYSGHGKSFHLTLSSGMPIVQAKINVTGKALEADFAVDTALDAPVLIFDRYADAHHVFTSHFRTIPATDLPSEGAGSAVLARLKSFQIGPFVIQAPIAQFSQKNRPSDGDARLAGEIGAGMMRRFTVILDYAHQQMILDPNSDINDDDREDMSGLSIIASGSNLRRFEVTQVRSGTPGADAGIQKGDVIAGVDDEPAADLTLADLRNLFHQLGHPYRLLIERDAKSFVVTMKLRRLL